MTTVNSGTEFACLFTINENELKIGELLGRGTFCDIHEARFCSEKKDVSGRSKELCKSSETVKKTKDIFAIKFLNKDSITDDIDLLRRHSDLLHEALLLSSIHHPNIINMIGVGSSDSVASDYSIGFFVALETLFGTLEDKLNLWASIATLSHRKSFSFVEEKKKLFAQRLWIARDVASALSYLHTHNIIHRDIKPENIGFDLQGNVKLFDFGLARKLNPSFQVGPNLYKLSSLIGTRRYMAPEIVKRLPYGPSADIYSFGILLWQICTLETPFESYDCNLHNKLVVYEGARPKVCDSWPSTLKNMIRCSWSDEIDQRPDTESIMTTVKEIIRSHDFFGLKPTAALTA